MKNKRYWWYGATSLFYMIIALYNPSLVIKSLQELLKILYSLIAPFILVIILLLLLENKKAKDLIKKAANSKHSLFFFILAGIISMGSVYLIYPLLSKFKKEGVSYAHIAAFLYARAVKVPLIPILAYYFSLKYAIIFNLVLIMFSFVIYFIIKFIEKQRWLE